MTNYLRPGSISYTAIKTNFGAGSLQAVDWHFWSSLRSDIQAARANDCEVINYCEPPRLTPGLSGNPTAASFFTPPGQPYSLTGWTNAGWLYKGNLQRPNPGYPGSYASDLSARNGMTGTAYMQHVVQWLCDRANDPNWDLDGFFLDSVGNDSMSGAFTGWAAGEAADFNEGGAILALMARAALGPDCILVSNNFWTANGSGPAAAAAVNGICNEHHDDSPTGGTWLANDYARCTNSKRRIIHIAGSTGCTAANADVNTLVTHVCINQPSGSSYSFAADPGTCPAVNNGAWPADAGHIHMMDSTTWGANPSGATGSGGAVTVTVAPSTASVQTSATQQFTATLTGSTATPAWKVNGTTGGNSTVGTITTGGFYTAPASVPSPATVTVSAVLPTSESGSASVTISAPAATLPAHPAIPNSSFGNTFSGTIQNAMTPDYTRGVFVTAPSDGTIDALQVGVDGLGAGTANQPFTLQVYSAAAGSARVGGTTEHIVVDNDAPAWVRLVPTATLNVVSGASYYFCIHSGGSGTPTANFWRKTTTGSSLSLADTYADGPVSSLSGGAAGDADISIYAEFTPAAPPPAVTVSVSPSTATLQVGGTTILFTVTVTGSTAAPVWSVNGISGGNSVIGTIDASGLYTPPVSLPDAGPTVTVSATVAGVSDSATVTLTVPVTVSVAPGAPSLLTGATQQFTATVSNAAAVTAWKVNGIVGGNATLGTISGTGLYTAPATVPPGGIVSVSASIATGESGTAAVAVAATPPPPPPGTILAATPVARRRGYGSSVMVADPVAGGR